MWPDDAYPRSRFGVDCRIQGGRVNCMSRAGREGALKGPGFNTPQNATKDGDLLWPTQPPPTTSPLSPPLRRDVCPRPAKRAVLCCWQKRPKSGDRSRKFRRGSSTWGPGTAKTIFSRWEGGRKGCIGRNWLRVRVRKACMCVRMGNRGRGGGVVNPFSDMAKAEKKSRGAVVR